VTDEGPFFSLCEKKDLELEKTSFFLAQPKKDIFSVI